MRLETGDIYYDKMADTPVLPQHDGSKLIKQLLALNIDIGGDNEDDVSSNENRSRKSAISEAIGRPCSVLLHPNDHLFPDWEPLKPIENFALEDGTIEHTDTHRHESIDADGKNVIRRSRVFSDNLGISRHDGKGKRRVESMASIDEDRSSAMSEKNIDFPDLQIRVAFLRFMTAFFQDYDKFVNFETKKFNEEEFVKSLDKVDRPFALVFMRTQIWDGFVRDRTDDVGREGALSRTDIGYAIQFFKESIYKKMNRSITLRTKYKTKFLDSPEFNHRNTFHAPLPIPILRSDGTMTRHIYTQGFPKLNKQYYGIIRKPRRIADYETQRRANAAVQQFLMQLHLNASEHEEDDEAEAVSPQVGQSKDDCTPLSAQHLSLEDGNAYDFAKREKSIIYAQSLWRGNVSRRNYAKTLAAIRTIQTNWGRMKHRTPLIRQRKACIKIQKLSRHFLFKSRRIKSVTAISGVRRMLLCRRFYLRRRRNIIKRQAIFRGYLTRKKLIISRFKKVIELRKQLFDLWKKLDKPLLYRSKFWILFGSKNTNVPFKQLNPKNPIYYYTFLEMGIHMDEVERLTLEAKTLQEKREGLSRQHTKLEAQTRLHNQSKLSQFLRKRRPGYAKHDRDELYDRLKAKVPKETREQYFDFFQLNSGTNGGKRRKHQLAERLFTKFEECDLSCQVVLSTIEQDDIGIDWVLNKKLRRINKNIYLTLQGTLKILCHN